MNTIFPAHDTQTLHFKGTKVLFSNFIQNEEIKKRY